MSAAAQTVHIAPQAESRPSSRWAPLLAGLPHLSMGIILSIDLFVRSFIPGHKTLPFFRSSNILFLPLLAICLVVFLYARRQHAPLWTASWDGYTVMIAMSVFTVLLGAVDEGSYVFQVGFTILALLAVPIGYFLRFRYAPRHALLMGLLLLPFSALIFLDTVPLFHQAVFVLALYLSYALLAAWVVVSPGWTAAVTVTWVVSILLAVIQGVVFAVYSAAPATRTILQAEARSMFLIQAGAISIFCFAPWLLWKVRDFFMRGTL